MTGRFAPTPSGRMHIGNVYAMLGAWLSARSRGERMVLRIEDIDRPRVLPDADRWIMDDLAWLGMDWDGDPVYQSDRLDRYEEALAALREAGVIYPCFCSRADIRAASAPNEGDGFVLYPGTCRRLLRSNPDEVRARLAAGRQHSLRLAVPQPEEGDSAVTFDDRVFDPQSFDLARDLGDTVIRRADSLFSYQLAVTVDDLDMGVTDIVRGRDLLRSTALQLHIRELLSDREPVPAPAFAHLPLIDNAAGKRLAKRERSLDMGALKARGVTPQQVIGYCAWLLRLVDEPVPCTPSDLLPNFSWSPLAANPQDRAIPDNPFAL